MKAKVTLARKTKSAEIGIQESNDLYPEEINVSPFL